MVSVWCQEVLGVSAKKQDETMSDITNGYTNINKKKADKKKGKIMKIPWSQIARSEQLIRNLLYPRILFEKSSNWGKAFITLIAKTLFVIKLEKTITTLLKQSPHYYTRAKVLMLL